jgi:carbamoyl-phosphate synthase large subunit
MNIAHTRKALTQFLSAAADVSEDHPVVVSKFIEHAKEIEIDAVADHGRVVIYAISEHVELSGVHSGDSSMVTPPQYTYLETLRRAKLIAKKIAKALEITGPFNVQFLARNNRLQVIECNLRSSRSLPFVSKVTGHNFAAIATDVILGRHEPTRYDTIDLDHVGVKSPQFSFERITGADPVLYVEMGSTGEAATLGADFEQALIYAFIATNRRPDLNAVLVSVGGRRHKAKLAESIAQLARRGTKLYATPGTHTFLKALGIPSEKVYKVSTGRKPSVLDLVADRRVDLVINIPNRGRRDRELSDGGRIRRSALEHGIPLVNDPELAKALIRSLPVLDNPPELKSLEAFTGLEGWK